MCVLTPPHICLLFDVYCMCFGGRMKMWPITPPCDKCSLQDQIFKKKFFTGFYVNPNMFSIEILSNPPKIIRSPVFVYYIPNASKMGSLFITQSNSSILEFPLDLVDTLTFGNDSKFWSSIQDVEGCPSPKVSLFLSFSLFLCMNLTGDNWK